jgi:hypothetical protein
MQLLNFIGLQQDNTLHTFKITFFYSVLDLDNVT